MDQLAGPIGLALLDATLICYTVSGVAISGVAIARPPEQTLRAIGRSVPWFMAAGVLNGGALLLMNHALNRGRVGIVAPIVALYDSLPRTARAHHGYPAARAAGGGSVSREPAQSGGGKAPRGAPAVRSGFPRQHAPARSLMLSCGRYRILIVKASTGGRATRDYPRPARGLMRYQ